MLDEQLSEEFKLLDSTYVIGIINSAEHRDMDLIAMVSHDRTGLSRMLLGSVMAGLLHRVDQPLLLARANGNK